MKFLIATCVLSVLLAVSAQETSKCGPKEVFTSCGTACPEHCPIRNAKTGELETGANRACTLNCVPGCFCAPGLVRDLKRNGECVEKSVCSPADIITPFVTAEEEKCGPNEVFLTCGTACPETCPTRNAKTGEIESGVHDVCVKMCKVGCACRHGFVRDLKRNGACVERALCTSP